MLAVAPIVYGEIAILEAKLTQVVTVKAAGAEAIDPGEYAREVFEFRARRYRFAGGLGGGQGAAGGRRRTCQRPLVGAGKHGNAAVGLDAHGHFGADQIKALRPYLAGQQAGAGNSDFGLGRAGNDRAVGIADHDVAQAQRGSPLLVTLDLGATD